VQITISACGSSSRCVPPPRHHPAGWHAHVEKHDGVRRRWSTPRARPRPQLGPFAVLGSKGAARATCGCQRCRAADRNSRLRRSSTRRAPALVTGLPRTCGRRRARRSSSTTRMRTGATWMERSRESHAACATARPRGDGSARSPRASRRSRGRAASPQAAADACSALAHQCRPMPRLVRTTCREALLKTRGQVRRLDAVTSSQSAAPALHRHRFRAAAPRRAACHRPHAPPLPR